MSKFSKNWIAVSLALVFVFAVSTNLQAAMSESQIQASVENLYEVKVLKIYPGKESGRAVFFVKVMFKGGNYNTAFQVNTLVIDASTGKRLPQFSHGASGQNLSGNFDSSPNRQSPGALRGHIWR
jgi:hypothetical protein